MSCQFLPLEMQVFYVDYGTVGEVQKKEVRFLHKRFSQHPIYAHRACLDRCKPNEGIWTLEAMEEFTKRVTSFFTDPIMAKVLNVNLEVNHNLSYLIECSSYVGKTDKTFLKKSK